MTKVVVMLRVAFTPELDPPAPWPRLGVEAYMHMHNTMSMCMYMCPAACYRTVRGTSVVLCSPAT